MFQVYHSRFLLRIELVNAFIPLAFCHDSMQEATKIKVADTFRLSLIMGCVNFDQLRFLFGFSGFANPQASIVDSAPPPPPRVLGTLLQQNAFNIIVTNHQPAFNNGVSELSSTRFRSD